jgi:hypothetical protein
MIYVKSCVVLALILFPAVVAMGMVDNSLVLHFTFDEGAGEKLIDDSVGKNNGVTKGNPKWVDGKSGKALEFDGMGDSVEVKHSDKLTLKTGLTLSMWVKAVASAEIKHSGIEKGGWEVGGYSIYPVYETGTVIQFFDLPPACGDAAIKGASIVGDWHYLVGTWDGKNISLYIDGELVKSGACDGELKANSQSLYIGSRLGNERFLTGTVDEVRIYNRALTQTEVKKDMATFGQIAVNPLQKLATCWGNVKYK